MAQDYQSIKAAGDQVYGELKRADCDSTKIASDMSALNAAIAKARSDAAAQNAGAERPRLDTLQDEAGRLQTALGPNNQCIDKDVSAALSNGFDHAIDTVIVSATPTGAE